MQVGQAYVLRLVYDDGVRVGNVQSILYDGSTEKEVVVAPHEIQHLVLKFLGFHPPVGYAYLHVGYKPVEDVMYGR